jgi:hypothetical protein
MPRFGATEELAEHGANEFLNMQANRLRWLAKRTVLCDEPATAAELLEIAGNIESLFGQSRLVRAET